MKFLKCFIKLPKDCRTSQNQPTNSWEVISEDENEYLETCPIFHDIDTQSIYGFDITTQPLRKSDETLWSDCKILKVTL